MLWSPFSGVYLGIIKFSYYGIENFLQKILSCAKDMILHSLKPISTKKRRKSAFFFISVGIAHILKTYSIP